LARFLQNTIPTGDLIMNTQKTQDNGSRSQNPGGLGSSLGNLGGSLQNYLKALQNLSTRPGKPVGGRPGR
jgi:hypothetical protein